MDYDRLFNIVGWILAPFILWFLAMFVWWLITNGPAQNCNAYLGCY